MLGKSSITLVAFAAFALVWAGCDSTFEPCVENPSSIGCPDSGQPDVVRRGSVSVGLTVTGELDRDRDGVSVTVGDRVVSVEPDQTQNFRMLPGSYAIAIDGVNANCRLESADSEVTVVAGERSVLNIAIACDPLGPATRRVDATVAGFASYAGADSPVPTGDLKLGCWADDGGLPDDCANVLIDFAGIGEAVSGRQVKNAYLRMYATELPAGPHQRTISYEVAPIEEEWNHQTGMDPRAEIGGVVYSAHLPSALSDPIEWNVTGIVRQWADRTLAPEGLLLRDGMASPYYEGNRSSDDHAPTPTTTW
jgi:hypothetical protein